MNTIYLVRHGESEVNITKEFSYKVVDKPLTPKGVLQAEQTAKFFTGKGIGEIYASPLERASQTARIIGETLGIEPVVVEGLREVNVGTLELTAPTAENWALYIGITERWAAGETDLHLPGGESADELAERFGRVLTDMNSRGDGRRILAVTHGGIVSYTLHALLGLTRTGSDLETPIHNCAVTTLELEYGGGLDGRIVKWMDAGHVHGEASDFVCGVPLSEDEDARNAKFKFLRENDCQSR